MTDLIKLCWSQQTTKMGIIISFIWNHRRHIYVYIYLYMYIPLEKVDNARVWITSCDGQGHTAVFNTGRTELLQRILSFYLTLLNSLAHTSAFDLNWHGRAVCRPSSWNCVRNQRKTALGGSRPKSNGRDTLFIYPGTQGSVQNKMRRAA